MEIDMNTKSDSSYAWPYVIAGVVIGGAVGYLFVTETGRKVRHGITHPDEMAENIDGARTFLKEKTQMATDQVQNLLQKAKHGIEAGQRAYEEAGQRLHSRTQEFHGKTVQNINQTAVTIEQNVVHPIVELGALLRGIEHGVRTVLGKERKTYRAEDIPDAGRFVA